MVLEEKCGYLVLDFGVSATVLSFLWRVGVLSLATTCFIELMVILVIVCDGYLKMVVVGVELGVGI